MAVSILGTATDVRTGTSVVYTQMNIPEYLAIVGDDFENFTLQRRRENHKAYGRLKSDIRDGALLPAITLSVKPENVDSILPIYNAYKENPSESGALLRELSRAGSVDILDGLQRTYIMRDIAREGHTFKPGQRILVEFWLEADIHKLIYRIIVLNAGQKPMSMRHQIELLFASLKDSILRAIPDLDVYLERDGTRRSKPRKFAFHVIVSAYQAMITQSSELQKNNIVANQLMESRALDISEYSLASLFDIFIKILSIYADLDTETFRIYRQGLVYEADIDLDVFLPANFMNWFASENVMIAFFAAQMQFSTSDDKRVRTDRAIQHLLEELRGSSPGSDPLGLGTFNELRSGVSPRKINVGVATRRLLTNGFKEYFRDEGDTSLSTCWKLAAE